MEAPAEREALYSKNLLSGDKLLVIFISHMAWREGWGDLLRRHPDVDTVQNDLFPFAFAVRGVVFVRGRSTHIRRAPEGTQSRGCDEVIFENDQLALLAVVMEDGGAVVERSRGAGLMLGDGNKGGGFGCGSQGFHICGWSS